jgi:hypothetical protein
MSVATIDTSVLTTAPTSIERRVGTVEAWLAHAASMRRVYTFTEYVPRHRAGGPAL